MQRDPLRSAANPLNSPKEIKGRRVDMLTFTRRIFITILINVQQNLMAIHRRFNELISHSAVLPASINDNFSSFNDSPMPIVRHLMSFNISLQITAIMLPTSKESQRKPLASSRLNAFAIRNSYSPMIFNYLI